MSIQRIHITGASGSGTTTLGKALAQRLQYRLLDADDYFWLPTTPPFKEKRDKTERMARILRDFHAQSSSIVSGSIVSWGGELEDSFDLIIFLWIPSEIRLERLRRREIERHGKIDEEFIAWAARYDTGEMSVRSKMIHEDWMRRRQCPILRVEGDVTVAERVNRTLDFMTTYEA